MADALFAALEYADRGMEVFAIGSKQPYRADGPFADDQGRGGFYAASTDEYRIRDQFAWYPDSGLALRPAHGVAVLDLDRYPLVMPGPVGKTLMAYTPRGLHVYHRWPYDPRPAVGLFRFADLRPHDSYVRIPPTEGYEWTEDGPNQCILDAPPWLLELRPDRSVVTRPELLRAAGGLVSRITDMLVADLAAEHSNGSDYTYDEVQAIVDSMLLRDLSRKLPRIVE